MSDENIHKDQTTPEGKVVKRKVDCYSAHQLFIMIGLKQNVIKKGIAGSHPMIVRNML